MLTRRTGERFTANIWPGFVDAMTAILLILMFILSIFKDLLFVQEKISTFASKLKRVELITGAFSHDYFPIPVGSSTSLLAYTSQSKRSFFACPKSGD